MKKKKKQNYNYESLKIDYESYYFSVVPFIEVARKLECWCLIIVGARDRGKTYSMLKYALEQREEIVFLKRTVEDVKLLIASSKHPERFEDDLSPYADINDDIGTNVQPVKIYEGLASFYNEQDDNKFKAGLCLALSKAKDYKGFGGFRKCKYFVFDEFIPKPWERVLSKMEGDSVMDLYSTIARDREQRGEEPLLLVALANANDLSNQLFNVLEITDQVADMAAHNEEIRKIGGKLVVLVDDSKLKVATDEKKTLVYQDMKDTVWGQVTFSNKFARNDLSCIGFKSIKGMTCRCKITYKRETWYVYQRENKFYVCDSNSNNRNIKSYDLNIEPDRKPCYLKECVALSDAYYKKNIMFQKFRMYDVLIHFKKFFDI